MDIIKISTDWARAEIFSAKIVWIFSFIIILSAIGFYFLGKTTMAKAFVIPLAVTDFLLTTIGIGLYTANKPRIIQFEKEYQTNSSAFIQKEIERTSKSNSDFELVFKVLPILVMIGAALILVSKSPNWQASGITLALLASFLMAVDSNTAARNETYRQQLLTHQSS